MKSAGVRAVEQPACKHRLFGEEGRQREPVDERGRERDEHDQRQQQPDEKRAPQAGPRLAEDVVHAGATGSSR